MWTFQNYDVHTQFRFLFAEVRYVQFALKLQYFCKISDGKIVWLPWKKNLNILSTFIFGNCKSDIGHLVTFSHYMYHSYTLLL